MCIISFAYPSSTSTYICISMIDWYRRATPRKPTPVSSVKPKKSETIRVHFEEEQFCLINWCFVCELSHTHAHTHNMLFNSPCASGCYAAAAGGVVLFVVRYLLWATPINCLSCICLSITNGHISRRLIIQDGRRMRIHPVKSTSTLFAPSRLCSLYLRAYFLTRCA